MFYFESTSRSEIVCKGKSKVLLEEVTLPALAGPSPPNNNFDIFHCVNND